MIALQKTTDAAGFAGMQKAATMAGKTFRDALSSTGMFEVQQVRLNSATDDYIKKLNQQKMSFRDMAKQRKIATAAYKEQLAMEQMMIRQGVGSAKGGKHTYDVIVPKNASAELDTAGKRLAFMNAELKSGAHQMVNWGKNTQWAGRQLMVGFTMPIAAFGAAAGVMAYQVDKELTRIAKVYDTLATDSAGIEKELSDLRVNSLETATAAAQEYGAAVQDTLNVTAELAATGLTGSQLQSASKEVMRIARLGEVDNQTAIDATVALQSVFRDTIKDSDDLADAFNYMNSIENATSLSTEDFATAIPVAAASVKAFGGDVKELGILLTAMKENGIQASEGANALKATMQRLGRPSKQVREEWQQLTNTDITKLVDDSDGLMEVFTNINNATKDLDDDSKRKAFAGLFGSYQVSKMMALTKGMGELEQGVGQVSTAYNVAQSSSESWANTAETEMERYQNSISGMWDVAYNTLKIEMAEVGEPFLVVATKVVEGVSWIVKSFNDLPQGVKVFAALAIGATALAGGVLMLTGLAANLAGNFVKVFASLTGMAVKMNIMDKDSRAAALATELSTNAELERQKALDMGIMHMNKYIHAQQAMTEAVMAHVYGPGVIPPGATYNPMEDPDSPAFVPGASARTAEDVATAERESNRLKEENDKLDAKRAQRQRATAAFMAVEAAGMATMMFTSNETAQNWAQIAMMTGLVVPAVSALGPVAKGIGSKLKDIPTAMGNAVGNASKLNKNLSLAPRLLGAIMGPIGWITTGLAIGGLALYKHIKGTLDEEQKVLDAQKKITESTSNWGDHVGLARREMEKFNVAQYAGMSQSDQNAFSKDQDYYNNTDTGKDEAKAFGDMGENSAMQQAAAMRILVNAQRDYGISLDRAKSMVAALWMEANGTGVQTAINNVNRLATELNAVGDSGSVDKVQNVYDALGRGLDSALDPEKFDHWWRVGGAAFEHAAESAEETGKDIGKSFADNFMNAEAGADAQANMDAFMDLTMKGWDGVWSEVNDSAREKLADLGIDTAEEFQKQWMTDSDVIKDALSSEPEYDLSSVENAADGAVGLENAMIGSAAAAMGLAKEVNTVAELQNDILVMSRTMSANDWGGLVDDDTIQRGEENLALYKDMQEIRRQLGDDAANEFGKATGADMAMFEQNVMNAANGIKQGSSMMEAWWFWTNKTKEDAKYVYHYADGTAVGARKTKKELEGAAGAASRLKSILGGLSFGNLNAETILNGARSAMEGIQGDIADAEESALDDRQQAASDRQDARFTRESDALGARLDRESDALDAAWDGKREGLEKYWDARIEGVEKAIEAEEKAEEKRKSMFEAEIARINRLADMANTNIDFNVALNEGNLDEAARISNSAKAEDEEFVFNREMERGSKKSENRVDKLEGKRDRLEDQKDSAMEAFDKREERAKAYFDNYRQMEENSLQKSQDAQRESLEKRQELEKKNLDRILDAFLAFTPKNKKQLEKHMNDLGLSLENFGTQTLDPMSVTWGTYFHDRFKEGLRTAGLEMKNDTMWKELGEKGKNDLIVALGFSGPQSWNHFMRTGEIKAFDETASKTGTTTNPNRPNAVEGYHTGGVVGSGGNSRKGVAKNYHGLHPNEVMVRALKGETVVNKEASERHAGILDDINAGRDPSVMGGAGSSIGGLMSGMIANMFMQGFAKNMAEKVTVAKQAAMPNYGPWSGQSTPTTYALAGVKPWVAEAANYLGSKFGITNIGGVGDRSNNPTSDHPMGLAADFMTTDVAKGNALAAEALKLMPALDATYMIWQKRIHSFDSRGWLPYSHPSGESSPTLDHMDHVHISFRPDGKAGDLPALPSTQTPNTNTNSPAGIVQGSGGSSHPLSGIGGKGGSIHGSPPAVDLGTVVGTPVHAVRSGVVTGSYDIPGYEPRAKHGGLGYRSYGRVITLAHDGGGSSLYAHLSQRFAQKGDRVAGGTVMGLSGNTGYSLGPHLHFGGTPSPLTYLRKGTEFVRYDNTPAMLHKGESVMTKQITSQLREGAERFARGDDNQYNVKVVIDGYNGDPDVLARKVAAIFERKNARMPSSRTVGQR